MSRERAVEKLQQEHESGLRTEDVRAAIAGSQYPDVEVLLPPKQLTASEVDATLKSLYRARASFAVKDSGQRQEFEGGMVRDTNEGKTRYDLVADGPMLRRWAEHLTLGAKKYAARNWMMAQGHVEYERFRESAFRHFMDWWEGKTDEDHAAAVLFNINGVEFLKERLTDESV